MITFDKEKDASTKLMQAMKSGNESAIQKAWRGFHASVAEQVMEDFREVVESNDSKVLAQRGYRQLTSRETKWYQKFIDAMKSANPKQAFTEFIGTDAEAVMPETIIEDVYRNLTEKHPLLSKVNFTHTGYVTKWVLSDTAVQKAVWGPINSAITEEIEGGLRVIEVNQAKLSAYAFIQKDMLELGPTFLDGYIRTVLSEALAYGLVDGIINGTGKDQPIGLVRDIHKGVSVNSTTGYPEKTPVAVTSFAPAEYGQLIAKLAKTEGGKTRNVGEVCLVCNPVDYYTKVMPATTVMSASGQYVNNLFPVPTEVLQESAVAEGKAVLFLPAEYSLFAGGQRNGVIEYSDDYKFIEDLRYFKVKQFATGSAFDDTCAVVLDISNLEPAFLNVKVAEGAASKAKATK